MSESGKKKNPVAGCIFVVAFFAILGAALVGSLFLMRSFEGSPTEAAGEFLKAMHLGDAGAARFACEPASGIPIEAALRFEPQAWGGAWALQVAPAGEDRAIVTARLTGKDGVTRTVELSARRFVSWRISGMKLDGRSSFGPAELPAGMVAPEIVEAAVTPAGGAGMEVTFVVTALQMEGKRASVVQAIVLTGPAGEEKLRSESMFDVDESSPGRARFSILLSVGGSGRHTLQITVTDRKSMLSAEKTVEFTLP